MADLVPTPPKPSGNPVLAPPLPRLRLLATEMVGMVQPGPIALDMQLKKGSFGRPVGIYALALGAVRATATGLDLWGSGDHLGAMLSFRFAWEAAITSQWLANTETGAEALINEQTRIRGQIRKNALTTAAYSELAASMSALGDVEELFTAVEAAGRNFYDRCLTFEGGAELYVTYRLMSQYCHPGPVYVDEWFDLFPNDEAGVRDVSKLDAETSTAWPAASVVAAMWAARSFDCHLQGRPYRSRLRAIAKELGARQCLQVLPAAVQREAVAVQGARRQAWTPPGHSVKENPETVGRTTGSV